MHCLKCWLSEVQGDALSLLEAQGMHQISEVAINEELFFSGAACGTCVIYRLVSLPLYFLLSSDIYASMIKYAASHVPDAPIQFQISVISCYRYGHAW